jgi:hypothetical protein
MTTMNTTTNLTGISETEFTLPTGQELPELNWQDEGRELYLMLREIDRVMNQTSWGTFGDRHREWDGAWTREFFRIRKQMGIFDPYSQTW